MGKLHADAAQKLERREPLTFNNRANLLDLIYKEATKYTMWA